MTEYTQYPSFLTRNVKMLLVCFLFVFPVKAVETKNSPFCLAPQSQVYRAYTLAAENQTSFFRDSGSLFVLFEETLDKVLKMKNEHLKYNGEKEALFIHSAGASDFKETYSVIMTLYMHYDKYPEKWGAYSPKDVYVQASDISVSAVSSGIQGAYTDIDIFLLQNTLIGERGFSEKEASDLISRFFDKVKQENSTFYVVKPEYKKNLIPRVGNLMEAAVHPPKADIILYNNIWRSVYYQMLGVEFLSSFKHFLQSFRRNNGGYLITNSLMSSLPVHLLKQGELDFYDVYSYAADPSGIDEEYSYSMTRYIGEFV